MQALVRPPSLARLIVGARPATWGGLRHRHDVIACNSTGKRTQQSYTPTKAPDLAGDAPPDAPPASPAGQAPPLAATPPPAAAALPATAFSAAATAQSQSNQLRIAWQRLLRELSSLPRAIAIMALIAIASGLGTIIPQNKAYDFYIERYPEGPGAVLGFLTYDVLLTLGLDRVYTAWWFYSLLGLLAASLAACTFTTQLPTVKVARRWRFAAAPAALPRLAGRAQALPNARLSDLGAALAAKGYQVFLRPAGTATPPSTISGAAEAGATASSSGRSADGGTASSSAGDGGGASSSTGGSTGGGGGGASLYAFKGLAGRLGPIGVHASMLVALAGVALSGVGGLKGSAMIPQGGDILVGERLAPGQDLARLPAGAAGVLHVNRFAIDTRPDGSVAQYFSDLSLLDPRTGQELKRKTIKVNDPFRYGGVTMYQTDWALTALTVTIQSDVGTASTSSGGSAASASATAGSQAAAMLRQLPGAPPASADGGADAGGGTGGSSFRLPLASLAGRAGMPADAKVWATFLPLSEPPADGSPPRGISMVAQDLQSVVFYDSKGAFAGVRRPGSGKPISVEGVSVVVDDVIGATGLELKSDPGVPLVYAGFGGLMITTLVSYVSHSQVWGLQVGQDVYLAGRSNRSKVMFDRELDGVIDAVPEVAPAAAAAQPAANV